MLDMNLQSLNEKQLSQVISKPWTADNKTFSDRCWTSRQQLINAVHTQLTQSILRGDSPSRAISSIAKQFNVSKNQAGRLIIDRNSLFCIRCTKIIVSIHWMLKDLKLLQP